MTTVLDSGLRAAIERVFGAACDVLDARPHALQSSCALTEIRLRDSGGEERQVVLKDLSARSRHPGPESLYDPRREIEAYRRLCSAPGLGLARLLGAEVDPDHDRYWLLIEHVEGVPLWQSGDPADWREVAHWLAGLHELDPPPAGPPWLRYDTGHYERWLPRALALAPDAGLAAIERAHAVAIERLAAEDSVTVHGDFYPSNVIVRAPRGSGVCPLDLELLGAGPAVLDLAALIAGLPASLAAAVVDAYARRRGRSLRRERLEQLLLCARLHLAVRWLGWMPGWRAPAHQRFDWIAEAHAAAAALEGLR
ncbi:MAG TPA: aminoglycoside phosphotransferase family protein [Conexibacter sp.]|nr:aminoglycoside phosphotransferase family protein [Conexibacter sp.]